MREQDLRQHQRGHLSSDGVTPRQNLTRRSALVAASAATLAGFRANAQDTTAIAQVTGGTVGGVRDGSVVRFLGVPYGASTAGAGRFAPPRPVTPWTGVRAATAFGQASPQLPPRGGLSDQNRPVLGEDCLVLNIWAPADVTAKKPVMVWLHGGGFVSGSGQNRVYDGTNLARRGDVIVLTLNHRVASAGFTDFSRVVGGAFADSANLGMRDILAALQWVRANIGEFGGDPGNVTIFGESGGGQKVSTLLAMPSAKGLFHRAVIQSGPFPRGLLPADADRAALAMLDELGLTPATAGALRTLPLETIIAAEAKVMAKFRGGLGRPSGFAPVVDGKILPVHPFDPVAAPTAASVPLMIGYNGTEITTLGADEAAYSLDEAGMMARVNELVGAKDAPGVVAAYRRMYPNDGPSDTWFRLVSDYMFLPLNSAIADTRAKAGGAPVYGYRFQWFSPVQGGRMRSSHGLEIAFVFDNTSAAGVARTGGGPEAARLAKSVSSAWVEFAKTGRPSAQGLPPWPQYTLDQRLGMHFNTQSTVAPMLDPYASQMITAAYAKSGGRMAESWIRRAPPGTPAP